MKYLKSTEIHQIQTIASGQNKKISPDLLEGLDQYREYLEKFNLNNKDLEIVITEAGRLAKDSKRIWVALLIQFSLETFRKIKYSNLLHAGIEL